MAFPGAPGYYCYTPTLGIPFQWDLSVYEATWARDASVEVMLALVSWQDRDDFLAEVLGYSRFSPGSPTLNRVLPLECPLRSGMWCDQCDKHDHGANPNRTDFVDPLHNYRPVQDWVRYRLTFRRPRIKVYSDSVLASRWANKEQYRYTTASILPRPRERLVAGWGYEYYQGADAGYSVAANWLPLPSEKVFIPEHQTDIRVVWHSVPIGAVPFSAIEACGTTVNSQPIQLVPYSRVWQPGELLFKGIGNPIELFEDATNRDTFDVQYLWTAQPGGWQSYLYRDPDNPTKLLYKPISLRRADGLHPNEKGAGIPPIAPPYLAADHQQLFVPSST